MKTLCCVNSSCLKWSCGGFRRIFGLNLHHEIKLAYFFLLLLFVAISLFLRKGIKHPSSYLVNISGCDSSQSGLKYCVSSAIILRLFFAVALVFFVLSFLAKIPGEKAKITNEGLWIVKLVWVGMLFGVSLLLGQSVFSIIMFMSALCWFFYSVIQSIVLIDLAYTMSIRFKSRIEMGAGKAPRLTNYLVIAASYACAIGLNVYGYNNWPIPKWISIFNSVMIGLLLLLAGFGGNKFNTVLLSGVVLSYIQILTYTTSKVMEEAGTAKLSTWALICWILLLLLTFVGILTQGSGRIKMGGSTINEKLELVTKEGEEENVGYLNSNKWTKFHLVMTVVSLGLPMVVSQWGKNHLGNHFDQLVYWQGLVSLFFGYLAYLWSVLCIKCWPDRDLSQLQSYFKEFQLN